MRRSINKHRALHEVIKKFSFRLFHRRDGRFHHFHRMEWRFLPGEDAKRTAHRNGAAVVASLRNLANGLYESETDEGGHAAVMVPATDLYERVAALATLKEPAGAMARPVRHHVQMNINPG
jgi:hypothetical protein